MRYEDIQHGMILSWVLEGVKCHGRIVGTEPDKDGDWDTLLLMPGCDTMHVWVHSEMELINFDTVIDDIMDI